MQRLFTVNTWLLRQFRCLSLDLNDKPGESIKPSESDEIKASEKRVRYTIEPRDEFKLPASAAKQKWFPKHMAIQFERMEARIRSTDLVVEVHDARIPLSGRNSEFQRRLFSIRPHILVLNKRDLIDAKYKERVETYYRDNGIENILWTDCKNRRKKALKDLQTMMLECLQNEHRFNRTVKTEYLVMVVGIPNVGKSSLINSLRTNNLGNEQKAVAEGARPGVTIRLQNRVRILDIPPVYILDTPGVLGTYTTDVEEIMKLGLCDTILETTQEKEHLADYLLYWMNKSYDYSYLRALGLSCLPTDDLQQLLLEICKSRDLRRSTIMPGQGRVERWDFQAAAGAFIDTFRYRKLRDCFLDKDKFC